MAKTSRRASRILAKERKRADRERAGNRRRFVRRLTIVCAGVAALLVVSGLALEWASWLGSTAVSAFEPSAMEQLQSMRIRTIPESSEEDLRESWQDLRELRREIGENTSRVMRIRSRVPALNVGDSPAEQTLAADDANRSMERAVPRAADIGAANPTLRRYLERVERRSARMR